MRPERENPSIRGTSFDLALKSFIFSGLWSETPGTSLEARTGVEPVYEVLQTSA